ncbi:MAG TPA: tetratricopeptide repeat protein [Pyrinomonadaceae bacterium]|nr:tetratricopeptide repeat protein [Pyrinomonadaceae bacterium]
MRRFCFLAMILLMLFGTVAAQEKEPQTAADYNNRGIARRKSGDLDGAIADATKAIGLNPDYAAAYNNRGNARKNKGDYDGAIADYTKVIALDAGYANAYNSLAWLLATAPKQELRDGKRAVELARKACELSKWQHPNQLDTLAAAYAEAGDF